MWNLTCVSSCEHDTTIHHRLQHLQLLLSCEHDFHVANMAFCEKGEDLFRVVRPQNVVNQELLVAAQPPQRHVIPVMTCKTRTDPHRSTQIHTDPHMKHHDYSIRAMMPALPYPIPASCHLGQRRRGLLLLRFA